MVMRLPIPQGGRINPAGRPLSEEEVQNILNIARRTAQSTPTLRDSEGTAFLQNQMGTNLGITLGSQIGAQLAQALPQAMDAAVMPQLGRELAIGFEPLTREISNASSALVGELQPTITQAADLAGKQVGDGIARGLAGAGQGGFAEAITKALGYLSIVLVAALAGGVALGIVLGRYATREKK